VFCLVTLQLSKSYFVCHISLKCGTSLHGTHLFQLVVVELLGTMEEATSSFLAKLGHRISALSGDSREISFLFQCVSVVVQRFNSVFAAGEFYCRQPPGG